MAGISILILLFVFMFTVASSLTGIVLFILSIILHKKEKDSQHNEKGGTGKRKAGIILAISLFLQIPMIVIISGVVISSAVRKAREIKSFEAIENEVIEREEEIPSYVNEYKVEEEITSSLVSETTAEMETEEDETDEADLQDDTEIYLYLADLDIPPLYAAFLRNEISVPNPFVAGDKLSFFDDRDYALEEHVFECASKIFSLVDVNNDGASELIFEIYDSPDELKYILGIQGDQLVCYDVFETHTSRMSFWIFDNGIVTWSQGYDGAEKIYYTYDEDGSPHELIHFVWEEADSDSGLYYDYYYMDGDETAKCSLQSNEEYEALVAPYKGGEPEWFFCDAFADIPKE